MTLGGRRDLHERKLPDEEARNRFWHRVGAVGPYLPKKHQIDQSLSFDNGFRPSFWSRGQTTFWKSKSPPPRGGLAGELNSFNHAGRACRPLVQRDQQRSTGSAMPSAVT